MSKFDVKIDEDLMDIMESFIELTEKDMEELSVAIDNNQSEKTMKLAHTLKGDSGGYGFTEMSEISRALEHACREEDSDGLKNHWQDLKDYWAEVKEAYKALRGSL